MPSSIRIAMLTPPNGRELLNRIEGGFIPRLPRGHYKKARAFLIVRRKWRCAFFFIFMVDRLIRFFQAHRVGTFRALLGLWGIALALSCVYWNIHHLDFHNYGDYGISDWLINYEGGFVRRGLLGQTLLTIWHIVPYPPYILIYAGIVLSLIGLCYLTFRLFKKEGWSYLLLFTPVFILPTFCSLHLAWTRKDYILILLACGTFYAYQRYVKGNSRIALLWMQLGSVTAILLHEASFFFIVPLLIVHRFQSLQNAQSTWLKSGMKTILLFLPAIIAEVACCIFKGNAEVANTIWESWKPAMDAYPMLTETTHMGDSIKALTWETFNTLKIHLTLNFRTSVIFNALPYSSIPFTLYLFVAAYYLITRMNTVDLKLHPLRAFNRTQLSDILLLEFLFMLPMFTVLSCDYGRTLHYWIIPTLFFFSLFKTDGSFVPKRLNRFSASLQSFIDKRPLLNNPWFYFFVAMTLPLPIYSGVNITACTPIRVVYGALKQLLQILSL